MKIYIYADNGDNTETSYKPIKSRREATSIINKHLALKECSYVEVKFEKRKE